MSEARIGDDGPSETVVVTREDEWFVAHDETSGVASQGRTKSEALQNLAEALSLHDEGTADVEAGEPDAPWF